MKIIINVIIICLFLFQNVISQITIDASLPKTQYLFGEPVEVGISIKNTSKQVIRENISKMVKLTVLDGNDNALPRSPLNVSYLPFETLIEANEEYFKIIELQTYFGTPYELAPLYIFYPVGKYKLVVDFMPPNSQTQKKEILFEVTEPAGNEAEIFNIFHGSITTKTSIDQKIAAYTSMYKKYPNSVYMRLILSRLRFIYDFHINDKEKALDVSKKMVENYSWSSSSAGLLEIIIANIANKEEKHKDTFMEKIVEKQIKAETK